MSFWAGVPQPGVDPATAWDWLVDGIAQVTDAAAEHGVTVALEPEPGMLVETVDDFQRLTRDLSERTSWPLRLALDTGHCLVTGERDPAAAVREFANNLGTVAIEDMRRGVHEHLPFGQGDMDIPRCWKRWRASASTGWSASSFPAKSTAPTSPSPKASTG